MATTLLKPPSLGPLVGHTTQTSARIWVRGVDIDEGHRTIGVGAIFLDKKVVPGSPQYFRLHRDYDRTGTIDFEKLTAGQSYVAKIGTLVLESEDPDVLVNDDIVFKTLPDAQTWIGELNALPPQESTAEFSTFPSPGSDSLRFVFGSCRYPGLFTKKKSDFIYKTIADFASKQKYQFLLLVGDQIYADELNRIIPIGKADTEGEFHERYVTAFGSPNQRKLMQRLPTYMILDDHEIEDNWVCGRLSGENNSRGLFSMAIQAYLSYQWVHGPRFQWEEDRNKAKYLYYEFDCLGFPFFVLDERSQRIKDDNDKNMEDNHLLGAPAKPTVDKWTYDGQLDRFCKWLVDQQGKVKDKPKFVVSASVFVPNDVTERRGKNPAKSDSWPAFPKTRQAILETIIKNDVRNVVFLSGDVHCSNIAEIFFEGTPGAEEIKAYSVTSSAFYWPFPFADGDPNTFVHDSKTEDDGFQILNGTVTMHYKARAFEQEDNFTEVVVDENKHEILVRNIGRDGQELKKNTLSYKERPAP